MSDKFWKDRNVLITGCTGLLGSWLTKSLIEKGSNIVGLVRDSVPKSDLNRSKTIGQINTVRGEIENYFLLERILNEYEIETVFHLAAQTIVTIANRNPISTFKSNIEGTWNILETCRKAPLVKGVIVASSDKAYGDQKKLPYDEDAPLAGRHPYDVSKSCADLLCRSYFETYGLPVSVTRCGNLYGGGDLNFNRIVPGTIKSVLNEARPVIRSDGTFCRDYFYVKDAVEAYTMLAEKIGKKGIDGEAFNFSPEHPLTVLALVDKILKVMGSNLEPEIQNKASNEIRDQYLSAKKARSVLDWHPLYTLEEGLSETARWYREFFRNEGRSWEK